MSTQLKLNDGDILVDAIDLKELIEKSVKQEHIKVWFAKVEALCDQARGAIALSIERDELKFKFEQEQTAHFETCLMEEALKKARTEDFAVLAGLQAQLDAINTPEINDFIKGVELEAKHQRLKHGAEGDGGKADLDWYWLIGYLAQKAVNAPTPEKRLHHCITTAAALLNWHAAKLGVYAAMRPGIEEPS